MRTDSGLADLYQRAAAATAKGSKSFYFATRFFPPELARSAHAVYWFCRTTDDLVDECPTVEQGRRDLEAWNLALRQALREGRSDEPVLELFTRALARHAIPSEYAYELIEGMRMDLDGVRYETFQDLRVFCYRVASTVGLMMSHVIGFEEPHRQREGLAYAEDLGIAMQLTNILRDIGEDLGRARLYLPAEDMRRFGVTEESLRAGHVQEPLRALMRFEIERARHYYAQAAPGIPMLRRDGRFAVQVAAEVYARILHQIEANGLDSLHQRAVVPSLQKYWLTARIMTGPVLRATAGRWLRRAAAR
jgi:15-cis-phytoene synthase